MVQHFRKVFLILLVLLLLVGCGPQTPTEPGTVPTDPTDPPAPTNDPVTETQPPQPDTVLDVTEINLADFENSLLFFVFEEDGCKIFRIYNDAEEYFIERYETDAISDGAILDGPIPVRSAIHNTTHIYHHIVLSNDFYVLHVRDEKTVLAHKFSDIWQPGTGLCFLQTEDLYAGQGETQLIMYYIRGDDLQEIYDVIQVYYDYRGTGIQIGGAIPMDPDS